MSSSSSSSSSSSGVDQVSGLNSSSTHPHHAHRSSRSSSGSSTPVIPGLSGLSNLVNSSLTGVQPSPHGSRPSTPLTSARSILGRKSVENDGGVLSSLNLSDNKEIGERGSFANKKIEHSREHSGDLNNNSNSNHSSSNTTTSPSLSSSSIAPLNLSTVARRLSHNKSNFSYIGLNNQFHSFFENHTVGEIDLKTSTQNLTEIDSTMSLDHAFTVLLKANVLSAPVYIKHSDGKKEYTGFLDVRDLVSSIVYTHENALHGPYPWNETWISTVCSNKFNSSTANPLSLVYLSRRNPFKPVNDSTTLIHAAKLLSQGLHRVPVVDNNGNCKAILSQSTLIDYILKNKSVLLQDWKHTIQQIQLGLCRVISISSDASAFAAFKLLETSGVSGIAVVDKEGKLVGNTSARDLKLFVLNKGTLSLDLPILEYLSQTRQRQEIAYETHPSCSVTPSSTIGHVIELIGATKHHRVFIVDLSGKPIGVIAVSDILRFVVADKDSQSGSGSNSQNPTPRK